MAAGRIDYVARNWSTIQREAELGVPESDSFLAVTTPATRMVNATHRGRFTCKQGYSPLGWNESVEVLKAPGSDGLRGAQGEGQFYCIGFRVPTGWVAPSGWGYGHQWYSIVEYDSGGPALGLQLRGLGTGNGTNLGGFFMIRAGGSPSVADGMTRKTFPFDLAADTDYCFIVYVLWSGYSNVYDPTNNAPPGGQVVGKLKVWKMIGADTDFSVFIDEPDIPTLQRAEGAKCFPGTVPPGAAGSGTPCSVTYFKHGLYRESKCGRVANNIGALQNTSADLPSRCLYGASGSQADNVVYHDPPAWCDTLTEARAEFGLAAEGGGGSDADVFTSLPAVPGGSARYGNVNEAALTSSGTLTSDRKRLTKLTIPANIASIAVTTIWYLIEVVGTGTQTLKLVAYNDDGGGGEAGTKLVESAEKTLAGPITKGWLKRTVTSTPMTGDVWAGSIAGATSAVARHYYDGSVAGSLRFNDDTYTGGAADPAGALTSGASVIGIAIEGVTTAGGGGGSSDVTAPVLQSADVAAQILRLHYDEPLDPASIPAVGAYAVTVNGVPRTVTAVAIPGSVVELTLSPPVAPGEVVVVSYTAGASPVQDVAGNNAANLTNQAVTNITPAPSTTAGRAVNPSSRAVNPAGRVAGRIRRGGESGGG